MSLKKIVGLLAGFALAVGLIGAGVGAVFTDSVTAKQNINVGTFSCVISDGGGGVISDGGHTVTYSDFTIMSSAPGSDPFHFTVKNTGSIADVLTVTPSGLGDPAFSVIGDPFAPVSLASGDTHLYNTGVQWTVLSNTNLGEKGSVTLTVNCGEQAAATAGTVIFDNTPTVVPASLPSYGAQAYSFNEWGGGVTFAGSARKLSTATVIMNSWACQSGDWTVPQGSPGACVTTPGATYSVPITFNVYNVSAGNVGSLITSKTQTFAIPYRPSSIAGGTAWNVAGNHGYNVPITFTFSGQTLPDTAIFGITYQTLSSGYPALGGTSGPADSLNIAVYPGTDVAAQAVVGTWLPDDTHSYVGVRGTPTMIGNAAVANMPTGASDNFVSQMPAVQITATN
jgi:hypothetical protein